MYLVRQLQNQLEGTYNHFSKVIVVAPGLYALSDIADIIARETDGLFYKRSR